jgi:hypothetical protein
MSKEKNNATQEGAKKRCFIIMPISDQKDYSPGHFSRVYEYLIKPACELAGFIPIRADDIKSTNLIALDIVKQIIECEMAICDLSSRNPNVLYEVGIRQAFNLPVAFIKDYRTERIFDIQGFRDVGYDDTLRIDTVRQEILELAETIQNTFENKNEVNSLVSLLGIQPAKISTTKISLETELLLSTLKVIDNRLSKLENSRSNTNVENLKIPPQVIIKPNVNGLKQMKLSDMQKLKIGDTVLHGSFGSGKVVAMDSIGTDILKLSINFPDLGQKQLLAKFAPLYFPANT